MKISILLPYKENFTHHTAGAVSLFVSQIVKKSKYKNIISVYGNTKSKKYLLPIYKNIFFERNILQSSSKNYVNSFLNIKNIKPAGREAFDSVKPPILRTLNTCR